MRRSTFYLGVISPLLVALDGEELLVLLLEFHEFLMFLIAS